jgi:multisubunit Na+/H+ antiporter MnhG subunit
MIRFVIGLFMLFGMVGNYDFYDECLAAADCVAQAPSTTTSIILAVVGLGLMFWGVNDMNTRENNF